MKMRKIGLVVLAVAIVLTAAVPWAAEKTMVIKYAHLGAPKPLESMIHAAL